MADRQFPSGFKVLKVIFWITEAEKRGRIFVWLKSFLRHSRKYFRLVIDLGRFINSFYNWWTMDFDDFSWHPIIETQKWFSFNLFFSGSVSFLWQTSSSLTASLSTLNIRRTWICGASRPSHLLVMALKSTNKFKSFYRINHLHLRIKIIMKHQSPKLSSSQDPNWSGSFSLCSSISSSWL